MSQIEKAVELYDLMFSRLERSKMASYQAQVYKEMRELVRNCATLEEAQERIKNSRYYHAPAIALIKDRIAALKKAAEQNELPDLAQIYANKLSEIEADENKAYETEFEYKAADIWRRNSIRINAFVKIFNQYCAIASAVANEREIASYRQDLIDAFKELESVGGDFVKLAEHPKFRALVCATDQRYRAFVSAAAIYRMSPPDMSDEKAQNEAELNTVWGSIKANEKTIKAIGERCKERTKRAHCIVVPPGSADGKYEYTDVSEEAY